MRGIIILPLALLICGSSGHRKTDGSQSTSEIPVGFDGLAKALYKNIAEDEKGNFVFSPISATIALAMLHATQKNKNSQSASLASVTVRDLLAKFNSFTGVDLKLANKIYLSHLATLNPEFNTQAKTFFNASAETIDFTDRDNAIRLINEWCEQQTDSKIKNIISSDQINDDTLMLLLNTVYFKGNWADQFDESLTSYQQFRLKSGIMKYVPTMYRADTSYRVGYLEDLKARFIQLPYKNNDENDDLSMYIILPDNSSELEDLERQILKINPFTFSSADYEDVDLYLPKFKIESNIDLKSILAKLGLNEMKTSIVDFGALSNYPNLELNKFSQKAVLEVNERGCEAAAISASSFDIKIGNLAPLEFRINHPFIVVIETKSEILFMARIDDPSPEI